MLSLIRIIRNTMSTWLLVDKFDNKKKLIESWLLTSQVSLKRNTFRFSSTLPLSLFQVDPTMYDDVNYILVDPSCSGSGIYKRLNYDSEVNYYGNQTKLCQW